MKKIFFVFMTGVCLHASAQNQEDVLRYSNQSITGSVRSLGLSGAWGAAGADLSCASLNPAGLGLYRRNEMMGSMAVTATRSNTNYNGNLMSDSRTMFNIPNFGMAFNFTDQYKGSQQTSGVVGGTVAFGWNRLNDFQTNTLYGGRVNNTTVGDGFAQASNGINFGTLEGSNYSGDLRSMAWRTYLTDTSGSANNYVSWQDKIGDSNYTVRHYGELQTRGRMNEWYVSGALNIANIVYLGGSLVFDHVEYTGTSKFQEDLVNSSLSGNPYMKAVINQNLETRGTGVGGKFGIILRPFDFIRLGASYHTPVRINLEDIYHSSISTEFKSNSYSEPKDDQKYTTKYQVITPERLVVSGSLIVGKIMSLSADIERMDYTRGRLQAKDNMSDFMQANDSVGSMFNVAYNMKAGVEFCGRYTRFRLGYALLGSAYKEDYVSKTDGAKHLVSAGFGWIYDDAYFFDLAISDRIGKDYITPYETAPVSAINTTHKLNFMFGMGYRF